MNHNIRPPVGLQDVHEAIQDELCKYSISNRVGMEIYTPSIDYSIFLLRQCAPYLFTIKSSVGVTDEYYLKISTHIVSVVLENVITVVNQLMRVYRSDLTDYFVIIAVRDAWKAMLYMGKYDMEPSFRSSVYDTNFAILENLVSNPNGLSNTLRQQANSYDGFCARVGVPDMDPNEMLYRDALFYRDCLLFTSHIDTSDVDLRTEEEFFNECQSIHGREQYIKRYPQGKYVDIVRQELMEHLQLCSTINDYEQLISICPDGLLKDSAIAQLHVLKLQQEEHLKKVQKETADRKRRKILLSIIILASFVSGLLYLILGLKGIMMMCTIITMLGCLCAFFCLYPAIFHIFAVITNQVRPHVAKQGKYWCWFCLLGAVVAAVFGIASRFLGGILG